MTFLGVRFFWSTLYIIVIYLQWTCKLNFQSEPQVKVRRTKKKMWRGKSVKNTFLKTGEKKKIVCKIKSIN